MSETRMQDNTREQRGRMRAWENVCTHIALNVCGVVCVHVHVCNQHACSVFFFYYLGQRRT